jgi:trimethylamine--corrinoid protein Co-methyltransferase
MEMLVIADEIIRMTRYIASGLTVNDTTLALDAIARVKPGSGFLMDDHTLDNWRGAQWIPRLIDRQRYDAWEKSGSKDLSVRAQERAREILSQHQVPAVPEEVEQVITAVLEEREK